MKVAMLSPISWRTPPRNYGPWELVASVLTEALVRKGIDVTLFATGDSKTAGKLEWVCPSPFSEANNMDAKVWECLHISLLMEQAAKFDIIHNHFDYLPLTYSQLIKTPMVTTIHGFSSEKIVPVYKKYNALTDYISISDADRNPQLRYTGTIYHGIDSSIFEFTPLKKDYLLFYGRIHPDKGTHTAIEISKRCGIPLKIAGPIHDQRYYQKDIAPLVDGKKIVYLGNLGQAAGRKVLGMAKALLHPIHFDEPFGLSVAESMMCGTPVIAFNRGSMPELVIDGKTGFLVRNITECIYAVKKLDQITAMDCRQFALSKFSIETMMDDYIHVYEEILDRSR